MNEQVIKKWDKSRHIAERMAADLAIQILGGRMNVLPTNEALAQEWDASEASAKRAKRFLASEDIIRKDLVGRFYIPN